MSVTVGVTVAEITMVNTKTTESNVSNNVNTDSRDNNGKHKNN